MKKYFLSTERLGFSVWAESDLPDALSLWGDPEVTKFIMADGKMSREQVEERLEKEIGNFEAYRVQYWPIYLRGTDELVGCCGLRPYDLPKNVLEFGVHIRSGYFRQGFGREAGSAAIKHAFETLNVTALFAGHNPKNVPSAQLLKRLGFTYTHDEFYAPTGLYHPSYIMTRDSYRALRQADGPNIW